MDRNAFGGYELDSITAHRLEIMARADALFHEEGWLHQTCGDRAGVYTVLSPLYYATCGDEGECYRVDLVKPHCDCMDFFLLGVCEHFFACEELQA